MDDKEDNWDLKGMAFVEEVASTCLCDTLRKVQRVCNVVVEVVPRKFLEEIGFAHNGTKPKRNNVRLSYQNTKMGFILAETRAVKSTWGEHPGCRSFGSKL